MQKWIGIVRDCRSSGKTIKTWCDDNGINLKSYYYWQRKVCLETCREIEAVQKPMPEVLPIKEKSVFAELSIPKNNVGKIAVSIQRDNMHINVYSGADTSTLETVFATLRKL
jgi:hypothetical protein